ncbi:hypothetical protein Acr_00g0007910 [Actinidia rufa]|uniref:Uncharacterized protein n=1 Tax=Actinidia rufa TaxID=165716 RepID=A0A7J0D8I4_9ERIC|nr:hypothetical protein Acr_00g0007910 [Actinidia rufa]
MVPNLAISLISSPSSLILHGWAIIFSLPDFFSNWPPHPAAAGDGTNKGISCPWSSGPSHGGEITVVPSFFGWVITAVPLSPFCLERGGLSFCMDAPISRKQDQIGRIDLRTWSLLSWYLSMMDFDHVILTSSLFDRDEKWVPNLFAELNG